MNHSFNVEVAKVYGVEIAVLLENFYFWFAHNRANNQNIRNGKVYTYNTANALSELFPYFKPRKIAELLRQMEAAGLLESAQFFAFDRTKSYTLTDKALLFFEQNKIEKATLPKSEKRPCLNTNINTNINTDVNNPTCAQGASEEKTNNAIQTDNDRIAHNERKKDKNEAEKKKISDKALELSQLLLNLHKEIDPKFKTNSLGKWAESIDKIHRIDGRGFDEIETVIKWAKADEFWRTNIISGDKLRKQFPQLFAKMHSAPKKGSYYQKPRMQNDVYDGSDWTAGL